MRPTCPASGKQVYRSQVSAERVIGWFLRGGNPGNGPVPVRAYQCPDCQKWHVTSKGGLS